MDLLDLMVKVGVKDEASGKLESLTSGAIARGVAMGQAMYSAFSAAANAIGSAVTEVVGGAVEAYAAYEQNVGGIQKLFGNAGQSLEEYAAANGAAVDAIQGEWQALEDAQNTVLANAAKAWQTAGMSANTYMENATGIAAALINSLGDDTQKAAEQVDVAMKAISDNVNTFGSDMDSVTDAFKGFAKQNYTMLDNLSIAGGMAA